jgi:hypothetical protein
VSRHKRIRVPLIIMPWRGMALPLSPTTNNCESPITKFKI